MQALVTGGWGFFGGILKRRLLAEGVRVVNVDLQADEDSHPLPTSVRGGIFATPNVSAHRRAADVGAIRVLKWIS